MEKQKRRCEKNESLRLFKDLKGKLLFEDLKPMVAGINGGGRR